jgi:hypothetical protein
MPELIVTFTTIPPRLPLLGEALRSLAAQRLRPDAVELYLPPAWRRFPGERPSLPPLPDWLTVVETDRDLGPATKVLPALQRHAGRAVDLLLCDDDMCHDPDWTTRLAALRRDRPEDVVCEYGLDLADLCGDPALIPADRPQPRARVNRPPPEALSQSLRRMAGGGPGLPYLAAPGHVDVFFGFRGALLRPGWIDPRARDLPDILWTVDDVWLSGMAALAGRRIWAGGAACWMQGRGTASAVAELVRHREHGVGRAAANRLCVDYLRKRFGLWPTGGTAPPVSER